MPIDYRLYQNNNKKSDFYGKWYAKASITKTITTEQLAELITDRCTVTDTDTLAVLHALARVIKKELQDGKRIKLDYLGAFKVGISTKPADDAKSFNISENLKNIHIIFQPDTVKDISSNKRIKTLLQGAKVQELPTDVSDRKKEENAAQDNENNGETTNP